MSSLRRFVVLAQPLRGCDEVRDVGGEIGVRELALASAEAREIEAQHRDAPGRERPADARGRERLLRAGEAMREQRISERVPGGESSRAARAVPSEPGKRIMAVRSFMSDLPIASRGVGGQQRPLQ